MSKFNNKPTGKYRSKAEARFASLLEEAELAYEYEPYRIKIFEAFKFDYYARWGKKLKELHKVAAITYTPDFVMDKEGRKIIIEIKGMRTPAYMLKKKLLLKYLLENEPDTLFVELCTVKDMKSFVAFAQYNKPLIDENVC